MKKLFYLLVIIFIPLFLDGCHKDTESQTASTSDSIPTQFSPESTIVSTTGENRRGSSITSYSKEFNDSNYLQLEAARHLGIEPVSDLSSCYFTKRPLVKITDNDLYHIDTLKHSIPYLVPEAANLLTDIGANFIDSIQKRGGYGYTIKVTSLLRTPESVGRLRRVNINATDSSTHQFGTTFDISYVNFYALPENSGLTQGYLKQTLAEVLRDLRNQQRCLVKYEHKTGCFHVTATR